MSSKSNKMMITENLTEEHELTWLVGNFAQVKNSKEAISAQTISFEMGNSIGLPVKLKWLLQWNEDKKEIGLYLTLDEAAPKGVTEVIVSIEAKIKNLLGGNYYSGTGSSSNLVAFRYYGWPKFMPKNVDITNLALTKDGSLPIHLTVRLMKLEKANSTNDLSSFASVPDLSTILKTNEQDLLFKIMSKEGTTIQVSRALVCAGSPWFREWFQRKELKPKAKKKSLVVKMVNLSYQSLDVLLTYLHTGTLKSCWSKEGVVEDVVFGADRLQMAELKKMLDIKVGKVCTVENCGKLLGLAKQFGMKTAEVELLQFFEGKLGQGQVSTKQVAQFLKDSNNRLDLGDGYGEEDGVSALKKIKKYLGVIFGK